MPETTMPAAEAESHAHEGDFNRYELAFHVLPTVAEGEVPAVVTALKSAIEANGGTILSEEAPQRFELAYDIIKYLGGRNRKFSSAYFGWIRFEMAAAEIAPLTEAVEGNKDLLRYLLVKLTKVEEAHPFYFHAALETPMSETIDIDESNAAVEAPQAEEAEVDKKETEEGSGSEITPGDAAETEAK